MSLKKCIDNLKFDTRMVESNLKNGFVSASDIENHLSSLKDVSSNCEEITFNDEDDLDNDIPVQETQQSQNSGFGQPDPNSFNGGFGGSNY